MALISSNIDVILILFSTCFATILVRLVPAILWPPYGGDSWYHAYLIEEIRNNNRRALKKTSKFVLEEKLTYPYFFHQVASFLPQKVLNTYPFLISLVSDLIHFSLVVIVSYFTMKYFYPQSNYVLSAAFAGFIFGTNPSLLGVGVGPRAYSLTPRPFSELLVVISIVFFELYRSSGLYLYLVCFSFFSGFAFLTSRFAIQVYLLTSPILAVLNFDARWLLMWPLGLLMAIVLSRGLFLNVFFGHFSYLKVYFKFLQHEHPSMKFRSSIFSSTDRLSIRSIARGIIATPLMIFISRNPILIISNLLFLFFLFFNYGMNPIEYSLGAFAASCTLVFSLTLAPFLRFLGEAERYAEYGVSAACIFITAVLVKYNFNLIGVVFIYVIITLPLLIFTWYLSRIYFNANRDNAEDIKEVIEYLKSLPRVEILLAISDKLSSLVARLTPHKVASSMDFFVWEKEWKMMFYSYPWQSNNYTFWKTKGVTMVLIDHRNSTKESIPDYNLASLRKMFYNRTYSIYRFNEV